MKAFIKDYCLKNIKFKLFILYVLNVSDIVFTLLLIGTGMYVEMNLLMVEAVQSMSSSFILKVLLPALLLIYIYLRIQKATDKQLKKSNLLINSILAMYAMVNMSHLLWILMLPVFKRAFI
ncbi:hypothetical protein OXPF_42940 [Oxobacter pfennigii]|uniref:DUF5658 domain-containing protein n=1 Tax=Oxobacter pfennigii TaxID=36849 RepID=A0A0P8WW73_9CLOT|nr:DUF5658 family protein [Oxobacter pfennigii]KPU42509.1 hypothetical protein OXPF_42940 [Oxobacter pfennigii]